MSFVLGIDEWEYGVVSECCNAGVYINGICSDCKDHCVSIVEDEEDEEWLLIIRLKFGQIWITKP